MICEFIFYQINFIFSLALIFKQRCFLFFIILYSIGLYSYEIRSSLARGSMCSRGIKFIYTVEKGLRFYLSNLKRSRNLYKKLNGKKRILGNSPVRIALRWESSGELGNKISNPLFDQYWIKVWNRVEIMKKYQLMFSVKKSERNGSWFI